MSLKCETPCDFGPCPYESGEYCSCEYWCGAEEPQDYPEAWECGVDEEPAPEPTSEDEELYDGCQFGGECENCEEYYWYT